MIGQTGKKTLTINVMLLFFTAAAMVFAFQAPVSGAPSPYSKRIAVDPLTGVALDGYDAVTYFTEPAPLLGLPEFEYYYEGVPWYFATQANRDVFVKSPELFMPMFGGYGTTSLSRGYLSEGNPRIYTVLADRLFVFYSSGNRDAFLLAPRPAYIKAQENWLVLRENLPVQ
jgi:hypothetical protein